MEFSFAQMAALKGFTAPADAAGGSLIQSWDFGSNQLVMGTAGSDIVYATNNADIVIADAVLFWRRKREAANDEAINAWRAAA